MKKEQKIAILEGFVRLAVGLFIATMLGKYAPLVFVGFKLLSLPLSK